jgi:hypothetical protein
VYSSSCLVTATMSGIGGLVLSPMLKEVGCMDLVAARSDLGDFGRVEKFVERDDLDDHEKRQYF